MSQPIDELECFATWMFCYEQNHSLTNPYGVKTLRHCGQLDLAFSTFVSDRSKRFPRSLYRPSILWWTSPQIADPKPRTMRYLTLWWMVMLRITPNCIKPFCFFFYWKVVGLGALHLATSTRTVEPHRTREEEFGSCRRYQRISTISLSYPEKNPRWHWWSEIIIIIITISLGSHAHVA
jgi:hypothetical protein